MNLNATGRAMRADLHARLLRDLLAVLERTTVHRYAKDCPRLRSLRWRAAVRNPLDLQPPPIVFAPTHEELRALVKERSVMCPTITVACDRCGARPVVVDVRNADKIIAHHHATESCFYRSICSPPCSGVGLLRSKAPRGHTVTLNCERWTLSTVPAGVRKTRRVWAPVPRVLALVHLRQLALLSGRAALARELLSAYRTPTSTRAGCRARGSGPRMRSSTTPTRSPTRQSSTTTCTLAWSQSSKCSDDTTPRKGFRCCRYPTRRSALNTPPSSSMSLTNSSPPSNARADHHHPIHPRRTPNKPISLCTSPMRAVRCSVCSRDRPVASERESAHAIVRAALREHGSTVTAAHALEVSRRVGYSYSSKITQPSAKGSRFESADDHTPASEGKRR